MAGASADARRAPSAPNRTGAKLYTWNELYPLAPPPPPSVSGGGGCGASAAWLRGASGVGEAGRGGGEWSRAVAATARDGTLWGDVEVETAEAARERGRICWV